LIGVGRAPQQETRSRTRALEGRHLAAASHLAPADMLVDAMRGRFRT
jgi:hypothetical protein